MKQSLQTIWESPTFTLAQAETEVTTRRHRVNGSTWFFLGSWTRIREISWDVCADRSTWSKGRKGVSCKEANPCLGQALLTSQNLLVLPALFMARITQRGRNLSLSHPRFTGAAHKLLCFQVAVSCLKLAVIQSFCLPVDGFAARSNKRTTFFSTYKHQHELFSARKSRSLGWRRDWRGWAIWILQPRRPRRTRLLLIARKKKFTSRAIHNVRWNRLVCGHRNHFLTKPGSGLRFFCHRFKGT